jgi:DNA modification methylase
MFIEHIVEIFREVRRVLKPTGTVFFNIGDTYFGGKGQSGRKDHNIEQRIAEGRTLQKKQWTLNEQDAPQDLCKADGKWLQPKQKLLIPDRTAIAMQEEGWLLRNQIIWYKHNHMPESMDDRFTRCYEEIFFFTKNPDYDFDLDAVREPSHTVPWSTKPSAKAYAGNSPRSNYQGKFEKAMAETVGSPRARLATREIVNFYNGKGKNPGDVWEVNTEQSSIKHYAMFPTKLVRRGLLAGCPKGGLVLDPFAGAGTTLFVARRLGYHYLGIEMNPQNVEIAKKRLLKAKLFTIKPGQVQLISKPIVVQASLGVSDY